jgi:hypothetical protein
MKKLFIIVGLLIFVLNGCYTVILTPEDRNTNIQDYYGYYPVEYYGDYGTYYDIPWWFNAPIVTVNSTQPLKRITDTQTIRDNNGSRNNTDTRNWELSTPPVSRDNSSTISKEKSVSSSGSTNEVRSNNNSSNNSSNSNSGTIRNGNGNRNTGNSRR